MNRQDIRKPVQCLSGFFYIYTFFPDGFLKLNVQKIYQPRHTYSTPVSSFRDEQHNSIRSVEAANNIKVKRRQSTNSRGSICRLNDGNRIDHCK